jgi:hypothetical protein
MLPTPHFHFFPLLLLRLSLFVDVLALWDDGTVVVVVECFSCLLSFLSRDDDDDDDDDDGFVSRGTPVAVCLFGLVLSASSSSSLSKRISRSRAREVRAELRTLLMDRADVITSACISGSILLISNPSNP